MTDRILLRILAAVFAVTTFHFSTTAGAQEAEEARSRATLEEIIVQTTKRAESAQTVPTAVTAFSGVRLEREHSVTLEDFNHSIPNVQLEHVGLFQAAGSFSMRGIGTAGIESFLDPVVSVFVDGVYYSRNAVNLLDLFDVESIEALRGPQGTLWGRNAFGGAIVVRTHRPEMDEFTVRFEGDVGNAGRLNGGVIANLPVVEGKVAMRIAANFHKLSGFFKDDGIVVDSYDPATLTLVTKVDENLKGTRHNGERSTYFRPSVRFTPNDKLDVTIAGEIWRDRGQGTTNWSQCYQPNSFPSPLGTGPSGVPDVHTIFGFPCKDPFGDPRFDIEGDGSDPFEASFDLSPDQTNHNIWGVTLNGDYTTSYGTFSLMFNHRDVEEDLTTDTDGFAWPLFSSTRTQSFHATQGELKFVSDFSDKFDVIAGVYFLKDHYQVNQFLWIFAHSPLFGGGGFDRNNPATSWGSNEQDRFSWAVYTQVDWHLTEKLTVILGGRYTYEKKDDIFGMAINNSNCPAGSVPAALDPTPIDPATNMPFPTALCNGVPFAGTDVTDVFDFNPAVRFGPTGTSWDSFSPRVGIDFQANDDLLFFAFWQRAFKSGGFVNNAGSLSVFVEPVGQERVDNFEIGVKSDWFDNTLRINLNAFYAKYSDLQRTVIREANTSTGQETFTDNAAGAKSIGVELEFSYIPTEGLNIFGVVGWLDIEYSDFLADINGDGNVTDNSGLKLVRAPHLDLQVGFTYDFEVGNGGLLTWGTNVTYTSAMELTTPNDVGFHRRPLTTLNGTLTWEAPSGDYRVSIFGRNITNSVRRLGGTPVATLFAFASVTQPRQFGISFVADM